jgi:hypothetical protein
VGWTSSVVWSLARSPSVDGTQRPRLIRVDRRSTRPEIRFPGASGIFRPVTGVGSRKSPDRAAGKSPDSCNGRRPGRGAPATCSSGVVGSSTHYGFDPVRRSSSHRRATFLVSRSACSGVREFWGGPWRVGTVCRGRPSGVPCQFAVFARSVSSAVVAQPRPSASDIPNFMKLLAGWVVPDRSSMRNSRISYRECQSGSRFRRSRTVATSGSRSAKSSTPTSMGIAGCASFPPSSRTVAAARSMEEPALIAAPRYTVRPPGPALCTETASTTGAATPRVRTQPTMRPTSSWGPLLDTGGITDDAELLRSKHVSATLLNHLVTACPV